MKFRWLIRIFLFVYAVMVLCSVPLSASAVSTLGDPPHELTLSLRVEIPDGDAIWTSGVGRLERISPLKARFVFSTPLKVEAKGTSLATVVRSLDIQARANDRGVMDFFELIQTDAALIVRRDMPAEDFLLRSKNGSLLAFAKNFDALPMPMILDRRTSFAVTFESLLARSPIWIDQNLKFDLRRIIEFDASVGRFGVSEETMSLNFDILQKFSTVTNLEDQTLLELIRRVEKVAELRKKISFKMFWSEGDEGQDLVNIILPEVPSSVVTSIGARRTCENLFKSI